MKEWDIHSDDADGSRLPLMPPMPPIEKKSLPEMNVEYEQIAAGWDHNQQNGADQGLLCQLYQWQGKIAQQLPQVKCLCKDWQESQMKINVLKTLAECQGSEDATLVYVVPWIRRQRQPRKRQPICC